MHERKLRGDNNRTWEDAIACTAVNISAAVSNAILAAVTSKRVYCHGLLLVPGAAVTLTIEDSDGTNILGPIDLAAKSPLFIGATEKPFLFTAEGKGLNILLGGAVQVGGMMLLSQY